MTDIYDPYLRLVIKPQGKRWSWTIEQQFERIDNPRTKKTELVWKNINIFNEPWNSIYSYDRLPEDNGISKTEYDAELAGRRAIAKFRADIGETQRVQKHIELNTTVIENL